MKKILIPLPSYGFDPTEVAIPWQILKDNNINITFITPNGKPAAADELMLKGKRLGIWKGLLKARKDAVLAYSKLEKDPNFLSPLSYNEVKEKDFDAIFLPGGHDKGVIEYLESTVLHNLVIDFFKANKTVGAICHGVIVAARSIDPETGKSVLYKYETTCLLKSQEKLAYNLTRLWLKDYYLTYPITVEDEVKSVLEDTKNFKKGKTPFLRDTMTKQERGFIVQDKNYLSARWPGDAYRFSVALAKMIHNQ